MSQEGENQGLFSGTRGMLREDESALTESRYFS